MMFISEQLTKITPMDVPTPDSVTAPRAPPLQYAAAHVATPRTDSDNAEQLASVQLSRRVMILDPSAAFRYNAPPSDTAGSGTTTPPP
eukprot:2859969-Prymnesium_polylepis.1